MHSVCCLILLLWLCVTSVSADLYNSSDPLVILDDKNIYSTILGSKNAWIIEFYNSWCGHCVNYAPKWREFSKLNKDWDHTISVGVVDCSDDENVPICRDFEVMAYPTIKIFGANSKKGDLGQGLKKIEIKDLQEAIIDFILEQQNKSSSSHSSINLLPYKGSLKDVFKHAPSTAKHAIVVVEKTESRVGRHTIMDLGRFPVAYIRTVDAKSKEVASMKITSFPAVVIFSRDGKLEHLSEKFSTREELTALIMHHLKLTKNESHLEKSERKKSKVIENGSSNKLLNESPLEGAGDGKPDEINNDILSYDDALPDAAYTPQKMTVFMVDMENAISYALRHEVILHKTITGDALTALKDFLNVLLKYFPARSQILDYLRQLNNFVTRTGDVLVEAEYEKALKYLTTPSSFLPDLQPWKGCQGSQPMYRTYPCGLWTLFHTITVNAFLKNKEILSYDPLEPLRGIHGYVKYFFSCESCSKHFQEMYAVDAETAVRAPRDEVLWLWKGHNKVNKRIKGDRSEDPKHPKQQFPSKEQCPSCWKGQDNFNIEEVLRYLKHIYGRESLSLKGVQQQPVVANVTRGNKQAKVFDIQRQNFRRNNMERTEEKIENNKINSWSFTNTDINLCVLLYVFSTVIIVCGYFMFLLKRRLRRKKFIEYHKMP